MALNLPNNLVFVPLDVLTAEELNQLMANDTFIANQFPLSGDNIATGAVNTTKLANSAVTSSKIDWTTIKGSGQYIDLGPIRIQWGNTQGADLSGKTVTLPAPFANDTYTVATSANFYETGSSYWWCFVKSQTTTSFVVNGGFQPSSGGAGSADSSMWVMWIAIGLKP